MPSRNARNAKRYGRNRTGKSFCTLKCFREHGSDDRRVAIPEYGPCPTCGVMFKSRYEKKYCTIRCYNRSPEFVAMARDHVAKLAAKAREKSGSSDPENPNVTINCLQCKTDFVRPWKRRGDRFCGKACRMRYHAERFDRFVANPETLALPQCYDEFLSQTELPCLVAGCQWVGRSLGLHANHAHGITVGKLRELGGFNRNAAMCTTDVSEMRSAIAAEHGLSDHAPPAKFTPGETRVPPPGGVRLQHRETLAKIGALNRVTPKPDRVVYCVWCHTLIPQFATAVKRYCGKRCKELSRLANGRAVRLADTLDSNPDSLSDPMVDGDRVAYPDRRRANGCDD